MGNSYVRQSAADIQTGNIVEADPINAEFNALQSAFDASAGHSHDGTVGEGQKISLTSSIVGVLPVANGGYGGIHNNSASTDPGVTNDSSQGYSVGSVWINTTAKSYFVCTDNTLGAAVWNSFQLVDSALGSIAGLTTTANQTIYTTGSDTYATTSLTAYGRSLIDDADATTARGTLGLGTIATQNSNSVSLSGGSITGITPNSLPTPLAATDGGTGVTSLSSLKTSLSLNNVDNTSDVNKPVSTATTTQLNLKMDKSGGTFTGGVSGTTLNLSSTLTGAAISGTTGTFSGTITSGGNAVWHVGNLNPADYASLAGATFTGAVNLAADPTVALGAATKQYVDGKTTGITNANLATMAQATVKGRASGAGTGTPTDLNDASLFAILGSLVPAKPIAGAGVGQFTSIGSTVGGSLTLPASGTWAAAWLGFTSASGILYAGFAANVTAGGTLVQAGVAGIIWVGFAWRIA